MTSFWWAESPQSVSLIGFRLLLNQKFRLISTLWESDRDKPEWNMAVVGPGGFARKIRGSSWVNTGTHSHRIRIRPTITRYIRTVSSGTRYHSTKRFNEGVGSLCVFALCTGKAHAQHFHFQSERFFVDQTSAQFKRRTVGVVVLGGGCRLSPGIGCALSRFTPP